MSREGPEEEVAVEPVNVVTCLIPSCCFRMFVFYFYFIFFWLCHVACEILFP